MPKTIRELADELGVSKQAIWQKIKRDASIDLRQFTSTKGNTVYVDVEEEVSAVNQRISELEQQIQNLKIAASREKQMNSRMNLIQKSRTIIQELKALKGEY